MVIDRAAERLRSQLVSGALLPGQRLSEVALSASLGISRTACFSGCSPRKACCATCPTAAFVAIPSMASIIDIYRVRRMVECQALAQAIAQHPARRAMREAVAEQRRLAQAGRWQDVGSANMRFHQGVVALADSERLDALFAHLLVELRLAFGMLRDAEFCTRPTSR
jgi:DNA-binding GntR family transcriptional regulator